MTVQTERLGLVENLAQTFSTKAGTNAVYGQPITQGELTIIPVAKVRFGLGGGSGAQKPGQGGSGGGGGAGILPIGYIEIKGGESRFVRLNTPMVILQTIAALSFGAWLVLRGARMLKKS